MSDISQLRLPMQAAPIERRPGAAALSGGAGMEPSDLVSDLLGAATTYGPSILGALSSFF